MRILFGSPPESPPAVLSAEGFLGFGHGYGFDSGYGSDYGDGSGYGSGYGNGDDYGEGSGKEIGAR